MPRLTLCRRKIPGKNDAECSLRIEFSAPKMLFKNNVNELRESDFNDLIDNLHDRLSLLGVNLKRSELTGASVSAIHYSKNILLDKHISVSMLTSELAKADVKKPLDVRWRDYSNGGHTLAFHANSYELVFYDKVADVLKSKVSDKRTTSRGNACQKTIFDELNEIERPNIFRMEARLGKKVKITQVFDAIGLAKGIKLIFSNVFKKNISRKVLLYYWGIMDRGLSYFSLDSSNANDITLALRRAAPKLSMSRVLAASNAYLMIKDIGVRRFRMDWNLFGAGYKKWRQLKNDISILEKNIGPSVKYEMLKIIPDSLKKFTPFKLAKGSLK